MKVYILFRRTWDPSEWRNDDHILNVYDSKEKADREKAKLEADEEEQYDSLSPLEREEWEEEGNSMDIFFIKEYVVQ